MILYIPGIHSGYIELFKKYPGASLYVLGPDVLDQFPILKREIRAIEPSTMFRILRNWGAFERVETANESTLTQLGKRNDVTIVLSTEHISDQLKEKYFARSNVIQEDIFLRFDEKSVRDADGETQFDYRVTKEGFFRKILGQIEVEAQKSSDWFRRVGTALIIQNPLRVAFFTHNQRMPTDQSSWLVGDPRMYINYGEMTELRTTLHAEQVLIARAARDGIKTKGGYCVLSVYPCPDCANAIVEAGISRLYFSRSCSAKYMLNTHEIFQTYRVEVWKIE